MKIVLFGGSFDPPHNGHLKISQTIVEKKLADQVWLIPCYSHPFSKTLTSPQYRLAMVSLLTNHNILASNYEIEKTGTSYSYDTLKHFQALHPQHHFSWLIGSDQLPNFHKWHQYQQLLRNCNVYVYPRSGYPFNPIYPEMTILKDFPVIDISSTQIRERVKQNESIEDLVPEKVRELIMGTKLYKIQFANTKFQ